jgi:hypothetical protein
MLFRQPFGAHILLPALRRRPRRDPRLPPQHQDAAHADRRILALARRAVARQSDYERIRAGRANCMRTSSVLQSAERYLDRADEAARARVCDGVVQAAWRAEAADYRSESSVRGGDRSTRELL